MYFKLRCRYIHNRDFQERHQQQMSTEIEELRSALFNKVCCVYPANLTRFGLAGIALSRVCRLRVQYVVPAGSATCHVRVIFQRKTN